MKSNGQNQWKEIPLKFLFTDRAIGAWGQEPTPENEGMVCIRAADFLTHQLKHATENLTRRVYESQEITSRILQKGDLILEKSGGGETQPVGRVISFELDEPALCSNFLERLRPNKKRLDSRFGAYLFYWLWSTNRNYPFIKQTTGIQNLDAEDYLSSFVFVPSVAQQRAIADYLDRETARLDALISAKQRLLEVLAEKRRALITHAVTRGLNPHAPMKESGVEWIGQIPGGWEVQRIKYLAEVGNGSTPLRENELYWFKGQYPWLTSTVVNNDIVASPSDYVTTIALRECSLPMVQPDSVLVAITGEGRTRGMAAILPYEATINQHLAYITPKNAEILPAYLQLALTASYENLRFISEGTGSTKGALTTEQLKEYYVPLPPLEEQRAIINYVIRSRNKIDDMISLTDRATNMLRERRVSLIASAVTGKLESKAESHVYAN